MSQSIAFTFQVSGAWLLAVSAAFSQSIELPATSQIESAKFTELATPLDSVRSLAINPRNNRQIFAASESGDSVLMDLDSGHIIWRKDLSANWQYDLKAVYSGDGSSIAVAEIGNLPRLFNTLTGSEHSPLSAPCKRRSENATYGAMAFSSDQRLLAAAEFDMSNSSLDIPMHVNVWDIQTGRCVIGFAMNSSEPIDGVSFTGDDSMLVVQRGLGISIFKVSNGDVVLHSAFVSIAEIMELKFGPFIHKAAFSPDYRYAVLAYGSYTYGGDMREPQFAISLIDLQRRARVWLRTIKGGVESLAFSSDGREIGFFNLNGTWGRLRTESGDLVHVRQERDWLSASESSVGSPPPHVFLEKLDRSVTVYSRGVLRIWNFD